MASLNKLIPKKIIKLHRKLFKTWKGNNYTCPNCNNNLKYFNPLPAMYIKLWKKHGFKIAHHQEMLNFENYNCPVCNSTDRDRLIILYLKKHFASLDRSEKYDFLELAPSKLISPYLKESSFISYRSADLFQPNVDDKVDITDMAIYKDNSFDFFLCSHMLEHVKDDIKAMAELFRILKPNGTGLLLVPIFLNLETSLEDNNVSTDEERWQKFGQNDHIRLYSKKDFISRLQSVGFKVQEITKDYFEVNTFIENGISNESVLYIVNK